MLISETALILPNDLYKFFASNKFNISSMEVQIYEIFNKI